MAAADSPFLTWQLTNYKACLFVCKTVLHTGYFAGINFFLKLCGDGKLCKPVTICASSVALCHQKSAKWTKPNYIQKVNKLELHVKSSHFLIIIPK